MTGQLTQPQRAIALIIYIVILLFANSLLFTQLIPTHLWFWAAFIAFFLAAFLSAPYFTAPKDAIQNSFAAFSTSIVVFLTETKVDTTVQNLWLIYSIFAIAVSIIAIFAMFQLDTTKPNRKKLGEIFTRVAGALGDPKFLFTGIFFLSLVTYHASNVHQIFWLSVFWVVIVNGSILERSWLVYKRIREKNQNLSKLPQYVGKIISWREPNIIRIEVEPNTFFSFGDLVVTYSLRDTCQLAIITNRYTLTDQSWVSALIFASEVPKDNIKFSLLPEAGLIAKCDEQSIEGAWLDCDLYKNKNRLAGFITEGSNINVVRIELVNNGVHIFEGQLISLQIQNDEVLFQIINGITRSENLEQADLHGYLQVEARKIGKWNSQTKQMEYVPWVPQPYTPAYFFDPIAYNFTEHCIGHIPQTDYGLTVDWDKLVTHNTAILGVLGTGKTHLAVELIIRMLNQGIRVFVFDITGEYASKLGVYVNQEKQNSSDETISVSIDSYIEKVDDNQGTGGNHPEFGNEIANHIKEFMTDPEWGLRIFNPFKFDVTEQSRGAYNNKAAFSKLTPAQITRIVTEEILRYIQHSTTAKAKLCIVLEEAHALVPEHNAVSFEGDRNASNATAKAILQGRKYGLGCLLITQRTAHVTKSILNQCNTIFALQTFDKTGMEFLSNYLGESYTELLSSLPPRQCVAYGKALNTQNPLIIKLNEYSDFEKVFPKPNLVFSVDTQPGNSYEDFPPPPDDADDVPF